MSDDMEQHEYECQCAGHTGDTTFYAAPPEWFEARNMGSTLPSWCPSCSGWRDMQEDEMLRCKECYGIIRLLKKYKIMYHRKVGIYEPPTMCTTCERRAKLGFPQRAKLTDRQDVDDIKVRVKSFRRQANSKNTPPPSSYRLVTDQAQYQHPVRSPLGGQEPRQVHVEHHAEWSAHSLVGQPGLHKTPTTLGISKASFAALLREASGLATETDPDKVIEVPLNNGRIAKIGLESNEKIILEPTTNGEYRLVTAYTARLSDI